MPLDPIRLTHDIKTTYVRYLESTFRVKDLRMRESFRKQLKEFTFFQGPIVEATPSFRQGARVSDLVREGVLAGAFTSITARAFPHLAQQPLYCHQEEAIRKVCEGRNVVVATGTGSGKTEAFLLPILDCLLREAAEGGLEPGVRALLVYPMNALANDQLRRLRQIFRAIEQELPGTHVTFGRFIGETQENESAAVEQFRVSHPGEEPAPGELLSREAMRETPPHILITNYAMLEYLLLRPGDSPLFDGAFAGRWRFIVLDEAHVYNGASGIEVGMLLRRLRERVCDGEGGRLSCVATSATLAAEESEYRHVASFASTLFGEPFEWIEDDPARQDVVHATVERQSGLSSEITALPEEYQTLSECLAHDERARLNASLRLVWGVDPKGGDIESILHAALGRDARVATLIDCLSESPTTPQDLAERVFPEIADNGKALAAVNALVQLGARARPDASAAPLVPARYHLFVRAPEGVFVSFAPETTVYLGRRERNQHGFAVFEVATCRRCGQVYLLGRIEDDGPTRRLTQVTPQGEERFSTDYLMVSDRTSLDEDNEDEDVAVPDDHLSQLGELLSLCTGCGRIHSLQSKKTCPCGHTGRLTVLHPPTRTDTLNRCYGCGLRSSNIVRHFILQKDAPAAVLATALVSNLDDRSRKVLAFSDSRQDAAFFAPYLQSTYSRIVFRRLMWKAIQSNSAADYRLVSLAQDVLALATEADLFDPHQDEPQRRQECWRWVLQEFAGLWDRKNSLEGVGLITFLPVFPDGWVPPQAVREMCASLPDDSLKDLYVLLLNTIRYNMAVTFPLDAPSPQDPFFAPRNREYSVRGEVSDKRRGVYAWLPAPSHSNGRSELMAKILPGAERDSLRRLLGAVWDDLARSWLNHGLSATRGSRGQGVSFRLDHRFWRVVKQDPGALLACDTCGSVSPVSTLPVCPVYNCRGSLQPLAQRNADFQNNHYRTLYEHMSPHRVRTHEHTAQLAPVYAAQVQQQFIKGEINVLSCSTTFELGVDLGDLEVTFLKNIPPQAANYVQRTGRAGRRSGSVGFALTFAQLRSHDLSHFNNPMGMVGGQVAAPRIDISNEKIIRRHVHSVALSHYFRDHRELYGTVDSFLALDQGANRSKEIREYLNRRPGKVRASLMRVVPDHMAHSLGVPDWSWVDDLCGESGALTIAEDRIRGEYQQLQDLYQEKTQEFIAEENQGRRNAINARMSWLDRRRQTTKKIYLLDFLASHAVIPKYGFPVDVVDLSLYGHDEHAKQIRLERDLRIAISEFAPGNVVVANGYLWKSTGLRLLPNRAWPTHSYSVCDSCGSFSLAPEDGTKTTEAVCATCGSKLPRAKWHRFLIPCFGFVSGIDAHPEPVGMFRPRRAHSSRPYFHTYGNPVVQPFAFANIAGTCTYSHTGELAVISRGPRGIGYYVCGSCGHATGTRPKKPGHTNSLGKECSGTLSGPFHLGHLFVTDVAVIEMSLASGQTPGISEYGFWLSVLYGIIEGTSDALDIERRDLGGALHPTGRGMSLSLYDSVPGGAGHVTRIIEENALERILNATLHRLESCTCGPETSCYSCLRNYENQFCHDELARGPVVEFLQAAMGLT